MASLFQSIETPEAGALIQINRFSGDSVFFGSEFAQPGGVSITIRQAEVHRSTGKTWYFPRRTYLEVRMSFSQFAEAITTLNMGSGVPCTMKHMDGAGEFPPIELTTDRALFEAEGSEAIDNCKSAIAQAIEALDSVKLSKKDRELLFNSLRKAQASIGDSLPFVAKQFEEHMEATVQKGKSELAGWLDMVQRGEALASVEQKLLKSQEKDNG